MDKITFKYKFDKNYNPHYVTGAFGGLTERGELVINFYLDRMALPIEQTHTVIDGHLELPGDKLPADLENTRIRFVDMGVIMNLQTAKELREWLDGRIQTLENAKSELGK